MSLFPLATFDVIDELTARDKCVQWEHYLGPSDRPFGEQYFGLFVAGDLVSVAVSASTAGVTAGGWARRQVVELARLVTHPSHRWATRVCLRLWREVAPRCWAKYWPVHACVSYSDNTRHKGDIYRFDGWTKVDDNTGSSGGGTYSKKKPRTAWKEADPLLKIFGVDVVRIDREVAAEQKALEARAQTGGTKAPTRGVCRYCGCTEDMACDGGCAWVDKEETVCSTASCVAAHKKASKKPAAKKGAKKR